MVNLIKHTHTATPSVTKLVCGALSIAVVVLSAVTRPTEWHEKIIESVWKENGLYILGIVGIVFSLVSFLLFTCTDLQKRFIELKYLDILLHFLACVVFMFFGAGVLYATLIVRVRVGICCDVLFEQSDQKCELEAFFGQLKHLNEPPNREFQRLPIPISRFDPYYDQVMTATGVVPPDIPECAWDFQWQDSWRCQNCINSAIQPMWGWKGAAGTIGIIISIFHAVIGVISISEMRNANAAVALKSKWNPQF